MTAVQSNPFTSGNRLIDGQKLDTNFAYPLISSENGIVAHAGGGQTNATQITARSNRISTVATGADSVKLPSSKPGMVVYLTNATATSMQVFAYSAATINDINGITTGVAQAGNSCVEYVCSVAGKWYAYGAGTAGAGNYTGNFDGVVGANTPAAGTFTAIVGTTGSFTDDVTIATGKAIKTDTTTAHTMLFQAYDVDGTAYKTFMTLTNGNTPSLGITAPSGGTIAIDGAVIGANTAAAGTFAAIVGTTLSTSGSHTFTTASSGIILKQGANGKCGTFVANGATPVTVNNTSIAITDTIVISLNTIGGTVGVQPHVATITGSSGFTVVCTASDTSTYNYAIISNAA